MSNGYFQLVKTVEGVGVKLFPAKDGGEDIRTMELQAYLERGGYTYDLTALHRAILEQREMVFPLGTGQCPPYKEDYQVTVSPDNMTAVARFFAPSETGKRLTIDEFVKDLRFHNITAGIQLETLKKHFEDPSYCTDLIVAKGKDPRHGTDAQIEYFFNTDVHVQPTMLEDGSVDFFHLNVINHCKKGDMLARIIPADEGEYGEDVIGNKIKPREVKKLMLKYGHNIQLSDDRLSITSMVNGHVMLVEDKVFVSDVYEVENVDISTGNIDFEGSVQVNGNVASNYEIKARGNVIINGVVEGAKIYADGNIIIARGMNGMSKGILEAGGNIVAKFLENAKAEAGGYVSTESILHSDVSAGTEITVSGKRGFITGGHIHAGNKISVKTLGAVMGASTIVEVGVSPQIKAQYMQTQKEVAEIVKVIRSVQPVIANFTEKKAKGARFSPDQVNYVKGAIKTLTEKKVELEQKSNLMKELQLLFDPTIKAEIEVLGEVYPGTTIVIGDVSMMIQTSYKYCRFEKREGEVKMMPL